VTRGHESLRSICDALCRVQRPIRVIRSLAWDRSVHERFLLKRGTELPQPSYPPLGFDPAKTLRELKDLRKRIRGVNGAEDLLRGVCDQTMAVVRLLSSRGTKDFYKHSVELFGHPRDEFAESSDEDLENLEIAKYWASRPRARKERATLDGMVNVLQGFQCGSVYKPIYLEAQDAVALATVLRAGKTPPSALLNGTTSPASGTAGNTQPASLLVPYWVDVSNMNATVIKDNFVDKTQLCTDAGAAACSAAGIS